MRFQRNHSNVRRPEERPDTDTGYDPLVPRTIILCKRQQFIHSNYPLNLNDRVRTLSDAGTKRLRVFSFTSRMRRLAPPGVDFSSSCSLVWVFIAYPFLAGSSTPPILPQTQDQTL